MFPAPPRPPETRCCGDDDDDDDDDVLEVADVVLVKEGGLEEAVDDAVVERLRGALVVVGGKEDGLYLFPAPPRPA